MRQVKKQNASDGRMSNWMIVSFRLRLVEEGGHGNSQMPVEIGKSQRDRIYIG